MAIPQRGQLALWELAENYLRSGKTIAVELYSGLGFVKSVTLNAEPVSTEDIKSVVSAAKGLATAKEDAELDALKREKGKLDAIANYLKRSRSSRTSSIRSRTNPKKKK